MNVTVYEELVPFEAYVPFETDADVDVEIVGIFDVTVEEDLEDLEDDSFELEARELEADELAELEFSDGIDVVLELLLLLLAASEDDIIVMKTNRSMLRTFIMTKDLKCESSSRL